MTSKRQQGPSDDRYSAVVSKKSSDNAIESALTKCVDDFVITARTESDLKNTRKKLNVAVEVGTWNQWPDIVDLNSAEVVQTATSIVISSRRLKSEVEVLTLSPS